MPENASFGTAKLASPEAAVPGVQRTGTGYSRSDPWWRIVSEVPSAPGATNANPSPVCRRTKSFIDTVSPARTSVRSSTACATKGPSQRPVGRLKRHGAMPSPQSVNANARSSDVRAVTTYSRRSCSPSQAGRSSRGGSARGMRAIPDASVRPSQWTRLRQSRTAIAALGTTEASESRVTHTSDDSRPSLTCTERSVTSAPARTWKVSSLPMSAAPSFGLASSTT